MLPAGVARAPARGGCAADCSNAPAGFDRLFGGRSWFLPIVEASPSWCGCARHAAQGCFPQSDKVSAKQVSIQMCIAGVFVAKCDRGKARRNRKETGAALSPSARLNNSDKGERSEHICKETKRRKNSSRNKETTTLDTKHQRQWVH
jgi:hypothetical protein